MTLGTRGDVLAAACRAAGFDARDARLLLDAATTTYLLAHDRIVVRIAPPGASASAVAGELRFAEWVDVEGIAAARPARPEPVTVAGSVLSFWTFMESAEPHPTHAELALALRRLHALVAPEWLRAAPIDPIGVSERRLATARSLDGQDRETLRQRCAELRPRYDAVSASAPHGPVHGDAHVHNLIRRADGAAALLDFEHAGFGPLTWDLVPTATHFRLGWISPEEHRTFCGAYGRDITRDTAFETLREIRELQMLTHIAQRDDAVARDEARRRVASLRERREPRGWVAL